METEKLYSSPMSTMEKLEKETLFKDSNLPLIKKGKICLNRGNEKRRRLTEWCDKCLENE